jgi:hypothetical protein
MDPYALQYYGAYCSNSAVNQCKIFSTNTPDEQKTIPELKKYIKT